MKIIALMILCEIIILVSGCSGENGVISSRLRISTKEVDFPINTQSPVNLKFKEGYFDSFVSIFSPDDWSKYEGYNLIVDIGGFSIVMRDDGWILHKDGEVFNLGEPNLPMLVLRGINRQKTPALWVKANWRSQEEKLIPLSRESYSFSGGILEVPICFKVIKSKPEFCGNSIKFLIRPNWYASGRM